MPVADSLNLYCPFRIWIGNRQLVAVAGCRFVEIVRFESATESTSGNLLPVESWIGNRLLVATCLFVELILSVSNLNRLPATSCQLFFVELICFGNWISNRQLDAGCRFRFETDNADCRLPIRWTYTGLSVSNRQLNRQPATESATGYLGPFIVSFESATESATGKLYRQPATGIPQLTLCFESATGNGQLNRQPATHC